MRRALDPRAIACDAMSEFSRDTSAEHLGGGHFRCELNANWWIARGANGGYLAAIMTRAMGRVAAELPPRSLTLHYTGAPEPGPASIEIEGLRSGRSLKTLRAEMRQDGRLIAAALGAFANAREGPAFLHREPPKAAPADQCPLFEGFHAFHRRWEYRWVFGAPPGSRHERALAGGWIRAAEPTPADAAYLAAVCDAFSPPYFATLRQDQIAPVPTVELTIHFRRGPAESGVAPRDFLLARFESRCAAEGFIEESGEVWTQDGVLLAECRQLATFL